MNTPDPAPSTEEQLQALFDQHADPELLKQFFEYRSVLLIDMNDDVELQCTAIGV